MHARRERLEKLGAEVVFISFDEPAAIRANLVDGVDLAFPLLVDRDREAYDAWGLRRLPWWNIWLDPKVWWQYGRMILGGERPRAAGADPYQMGGDFIVNGEGRVVYSRPQRRDDRPAIGELIRALEASASG